ncbi:hypothetical protein BDN72DRAFT_900019 [Pluteus cervinus]|uniref:Uncharacterized protein n=1 Tax=Pluteus cervinus TaxID=181527 RepID=A0ACD3AK07_9AGAR|nr:hypothetical protein BDN72DRAFT_900019 [Pluteus cervinus]
MRRYSPPSPVTPTTVNHHHSTRSKSSPSPPCDTGSSLTDGRRVLRPRCDCKKVHGPDQCPLRREGVHAPTTGLSSPPESPPTTSSRPDPQPEQSQRFTSPKRTRSRKSAVDLPSLPASPLRRQDAVEIHYNHAGDTHDLDGTTTPPRPQAQAQAQLQGSPLPLDWQPSFTIPGDRAFRRRNPNWKDPTPEPSPRRPIARSPSQDTELIDESTTLLGRGKGMLAGMFVQARGHLPPPPQFPLIMPRIEATRRTGLDTLPNSLVLQKRESKSRSRSRSSTSSLDLDEEIDPDPMDLVRDVMDTGYLGQLIKFGASRKEVEWIKDVLGSQFFLGVINHRTTEEHRPGEESEERRLDEEDLPSLEQISSSSSRRHERVPSCTVFISDDKDIFDRAFGYEERERLHAEERRRVHEEHVETLLGLSQQMRGVYEQELAWMRPKLGLMFICAVGLGALCMLLWLTSWINVPVLRR